MSFLANVNVARFTVRQLQMTAYYQGQYKGQIKWFDRKKKYGLITNGETKNDVLFLQTGLSTIILFEIKFFFRLHQELQEARESVSSSKYES